MDKSDREMLIRVDERTLQILKNQEAQQAAIGSNTEDIQSLKQSRAKMLGAAGVVSAVFGFLTSYFSGVKS